MMKKILMDYVPAIGFLPVMCLVGAFAVFWLLFSVIIFLLFPLGASDRRHKLNCIYKLSMFEKDI